MAEEQVSFSTPYSASSGAMLLTIGRIDLDWEHREINILLIGSGVRQVASYLGDDAVSLMSLLNTLNLSTRSLKKRIFDKLIADGKIPTGTV